MAVNIFQSLKGLILTSQSVRSRPRTHRFQSLKGLILTLGLVSEGDYEIKISIPQRSDFNISRGQGETKQITFQSLKGLILTPCRQQ